MTPRPIVVPVRHHSPACARLVRHLIRTLLPKVVLVEGPPEASHLIPALLDEATQAPVALMAYFAPTRRQSSPIPDHPPTIFFPFCDYSPEWVAMREGHACGAEVQFCDIPAAQMLLHEELDQPALSSLPLDFAEAAGFTSHEEWWESAFEGSEHPPETLMRLLTLYAREIAGAPDAYTLAREQWMWKAVQEAVKRVGDPKRVMLVCGASHAVRLPPDGDWIPEQPTSTEASVEFALTPYTFTHLSRTSGYGAGNAAPLLFQRVWQLGSLAQAAADTLCEASRALRDRGWDTSTADVIAAHGTACQLAGLRNKTAPGAHEIQRVAHTVWTQNPAQVNQVITELLVGSTAGAVSDTAGATPLVEDFQRRARRFWRLIDGTEREGRLRLTIAAEREQSVFLHQLRAAGIEFARLRSAERGGDPGHSLWTQYEVWLRRWTHSTAITLAEKSPLGATVEEIAVYALAMRLSQPQSLADSVATLLDTALCGMATLLHPALAAVDTASLEMAAWETLADSAVRLARLGGNPAIPEDVGDATAIAARRIAARAVVHLPRAARCADDRARPFGVALTSLHEVISAGSLVEPEQWDAALAQLAEGNQANPYLSGLAAALLESSRPSRSLTRRIGLRLSPGVEPDDAVLYIEGLLSLNRTVLLRAPVIVSAIHAFVTGLRDTEFLGVLPVLRRTFGGLSAAELRSLLGTLDSMLFGAGAHLAAAEQTLDQALTAVEQRIGQAMEEGAAHVDRASIRDAAAAAMELFQTSSAAEPAPLSRVRIRIIERLQDLVEKGPAASTLLPLQDALEQYRLARPTSRVPPQWYRISGLSLVAAPETPTGPGWRPPDMRRDIDQILTDTRQETRPDRVRVVAEAAVLDAAAGDASLRPLLAHGDYTELLIRLLAEHDSEAARECLASNNPLVRRSGLLIARRMLQSVETTDTAEALRLDASDLLASALGDDMHWRDAVRSLRDHPERLLEWLLGRPDAAVAPGSRGELRRARATAAFLDYPPATPWLTQCLDQSDRLVLEASATLVLLGAIQEEELRWSVRARPGEHSQRALLRFELESGGRSPAALSEYPYDEELAGMLGPAVVRRMLNLWKDLESPAQRLPFVPWLAAAAGDAVVPILGPLVSTGSPILAAVAASGLACIGSPRSVMYLHSRATPRGSDTDFAILRSLAVLGDLRLLERLKARLGPVHPESVLPEELQAIRQLGDAAGLVLPGWLQDPSRAVQAVAAAVLESLNDSGTDAWWASLDPEDRLRRLCARCLLPGEIDPEIEDRLLSAAGGAGSRAVEPLVAALKVASGPAELALSRVLERLRLPASILPLLRIPREAPWKLTIPAAMGDAAIPHLAAALVAPEPHVQQSARAALRAIGTPAATKAAAPGARERRRK